MRNPDSKVRWLIVFSSLWAVHGAAAESVREDRAAGQVAYAEFQRLLAAHEYPGALQRAHEIVRIEESRNDGSRALSVAYHQLGKLQLLTGDANAAVASLHRALQLLEISDSIASPNFIGPLVDLAAAHAALGAHEAAIATMQQAIAIGRRANGLFNIEQMELLDRIAENFEKVGDIAGVDYARRYAVLAAEQQFGPEHPDCLPAIGKLADWFELTGRYAMARNLYERMARMASLEGDGRNATVINALLGVGRSHRLQYVETPELVENSVWGSRPGMQFDPVTGQRKAIAGAVERPGLGATARLNPLGRDALMKSLEILQSASDPPPDLLARTLVEIGDWHQTDRDATRAMAYYKQAWPLLVATSTEQSPNPLLAPRPMFYRLPPEWRQNRAMPYRNAVKLHVEFVVTISDRGDVSDLVRKGGDMTEGQGWQVARALQRASFSPRFENGEPVATVDFPFTAYRFETEREPATASAEPAKP